MSTATVVFLTLSLASQAQTPAPRSTPAATPTTGTASLAGKVVDDEERPAAVRRAIVTVAGAGLVPSRSAITDDEGQFAVEGLPAGRFTITVSRASFVTSAYGAKRPGKPGTPVTLAAGQHVTNLSVRLWRGAVIAGLVQTEDGQPAAGLPVRVLAAHQPTEATIFTLDNNGVKTDEGGEFRIFGLLPGTYIVSVTPPSLRGMSPTAMSEADMDAALTALRTRTPVRNGQPSPPPAAGPAASRPFTFAPIYFPGTASMREATPVTVTPGQVLEHIDLKLQRVVAASVSGTVTLADGRPAPRAQIQIALIPPDGYRLDAPVGYTPNAPLQAGATATAAGTFRLPAVGPGDYALTVKATAPTAAGDTPTSSPTLWGGTTISVWSDDLTGLALQVEPGPTLSGRVIFDGSTLKPPVDLTQWRVSLITPASLTSRGPGLGTTLTRVPPVALQADGSFTIPGLPPGPLLFRMTGPGIGLTGWSMRSLASGDRNLLDGTIDAHPGSAPLSAVLSMSDRHTELSGTLRSSSGQPAADVFVIAFSSDRTMWGPGARRVRAVRPGVDGRFSIADLPPGDYQLGAVTDIDADDWQNPALLEQLMAASIKITLGEGEKKIQDLQLGRQATTVRTGG